MSFLVRFTSSGGTTQQYDEVIRRIAEGGDWPPDGLEYHVCFLADDGSVGVSEIWESDEKFAAFGERVMPIHADVGVEGGELERFEVHNIVKP
jgi:hypothetical protein